MKKVIIFLIAFLMINVVVTAYGFDAKENKNTFIKNKFFAIEMPAELKGSYFSKVKKDKIEIYDKESNKAGFGGFAFGVKVYKNPKDHATLPGSKKIGELTDKKGVLYDVVLKHPTDVQYDYTKSEKPPEKFKNLYELGDNISIEAVKGAKYFKNQGMKGEDLYKDVLKKYIKEIKAKSNSETLEKNNMSYMYNVLAQSGENVLNKIGFAYYDVNYDGIDELFIGEIAQGAWKGVVYDIYTMVDRKPVHVVSGGSRNRYFVCDDAFICNEYSSGANESGVRVYALLENSTELFPQVSFKYDRYVNKKKPWFISYGGEVEDDKWENVDEKTFKERKSVFERYNRFDYIPLSSYVYY